MNLYLRQQLEKVDSVLAQVIDDLEYRTNHQHDALTSEEEEEIRDWVESFENLRGEINDDN